MNEDQSEDKAYWQSLQQWARATGEPQVGAAGTSADVQGESVGGGAATGEFSSTPLKEGAEDGWARREFMKLMGASLALSTTACVRRPVQKIVPYNKQPEEVTFGVDNFYTSTWFDGSEGFGLLIKTREGRPLKVEGNPRFPLNAHGLSPRALAHILSLYDPDRLREPLRNIQNKEKGKERANHDSVATKWDAADEEVVASLKKGGVALLTGSLPSPATRAVIADFLQGFPGQHYEWDPLSVEDVRRAQELCYGHDLVPSYRINRARLIVSVDSDFLGTWLTPTTFQRQFAEGRRDANRMNKLVAFDSNYSVTGANADVRVKIKPSLQLDVVMGLAFEIIVKKQATRWAGNSQLAQVLQPFADAAQRLGVEAHVWSRLADELIQYKGESLVIAGGLPAQTAQGIELQSAVNLLNSALENDGVTVDYRRPFKGLAGAHSSLEHLIESMEKGEVTTLIVHRANPVYASPLSARFLAALKKVPMVVSTSDRNDETAKFADFVLPDSHPMESWGDAEFVEGLFAIQQPTIRPLFDTRSFQFSLMSWAYLAEKGPERLRKFENFYDYLKNYWKTEVFPRYGKGKSFVDFWEQALQTGMVGEPSEGVSEAGKGSSVIGAVRDVKLEALSGIKRTDSPQGYELVLYPTKALYDGSLANVSWLQELPDPVTKITWDNYLCVSVNTAKKENLVDEGLAELKVGELALKLPVHVQPGLHDGVLAVAVGYGRTDAGSVGNHVGVNVYPLAGVSGELKGRPIFSGRSATVTRLRGKYPLAMTQDHHSMEGRKIVVEATLKEYLKNPAVHNHKHHVWSIWGGHAYNGNKWAMAVDLNTCTGCNACVVACQSENNIPVVGKKYVIQGREMHWMRIDRYYVGEPDNAEVVFQPVMCQQCTNAPCETVCPVLATTHSSDGLNDMTYNRCVGTRYCSNNCPYKVRRFNWFSFNGNIEKPLHLALNPDVTVRDRGVMEKCTFCVQRIKAKRIQVKLEGRGLKDGDIQTACQQSCPSSAIMFGDINDPNSRVSQWFKEARAYSLLEEFGADPSVRYLTKIRNNEQETRSAESAKVEHQVEPQVEHQGGRT
ncbi:MAG: molybdopterin oxidoreductase [Bdellovibrio sp.]|nr:MAG: molybdopterin oxidoreductase [Bdellovibrio sp.]